MTGKGNTRARAPDANPRTGFSRLFERALGIGGAVGLSAAADVFVGMVEAPLLVRPYLGALSRGALFSITSCGMATIAGTVMVLYASIRSWSPTSTSRDCRRAS